MVPSSPALYSFARYKKPSSIEFISKWKTNDVLNFDFNYTYTSTYDGAEQDDPNKNSD